MNDSKNNFLNPISIGSSLFVFFILSLSIFFPKILFKTLSWIQGIFVINISWFYILAIFLLFSLCLYLIFSRHGNIRLGAISKPRYNNFTWISMLFSAGMGTGLLFSAVYEPLHHYIYPPTGKGLTEEAFNLSYQLTFLHWGFSGWIIYASMGMMFAYFCLYKKLPFRLSYMLYPIFKDKIKGPLGYMIDIFAVVAILFGVACSLGRGALQISSGVRYIFHFPISEQIQQISIICGITAFATISVLSGLNKGIRRLSEVNIIFCFALLIFILSLGPTIHIFNSFVEQSGAYLQNLVSNLTQIRSLGSSEWRSQWTILYWAWWFAWSPFVGIFIAKISEGRTLRTFIIGTILIPSTISFLWFTVFGGTAIYYQMNGLIDLSSLLKSEYTLTLFKFLEAFPFAKISSIIGIITVALFFITSSDSASYVIHHISSKRVTQMGKTYWALLEGVLAIILLLSGGLRSLELLVIITAFPFTILLLVACYGFLKEILTEGELEPPIGDKRKHSP